MAGDEVEYPTEYMNSLANTKQTKWAERLHRGRPEDPRRARGQGARSATCRSWPPTARSSRRSARSTSRRCAAPRTTSTRWRRASGRRPSRCRTGTTRRAPPSSSCGSGGRTARSRAPRTTSRPRPRSRRRPRPRPPSRPRPRPPARRRARRRGRPEGEAPADGEHRRQPRDEGAVPTGGPTSDVPHPAVTMPARSPRRPPRGRPRRRRRGWRWRPWSACPRPRRTRWTTGSGGATAMGVDELHRTGAGQGVTVAVIDGPIDSSVPELRGPGRVLEHRVPDAGRATGRPPRARVAAADHATSMASLIVGSGKGTAAGGRGIAGIAPRATLRHYAVLYAKTTDGGRDGCRLDDPGLDQSGAATARAIRQAVEDGARVLSISLSVDYDAHARRRPARRLPRRRDRRRLDQQRHPQRLLARDRQRRRHGDPRRRPGEPRLQRPAREPAARLRGAGEQGRLRRVDLVRVAQRRHRRRRLAGHGHHGGGPRGALVGPPRRHGQPGPPGRQGRHRHARRERHVPHLVPARGQRPAEATGKTESYGFGIFAPADAVRLDVASLPDTNPMVVDTGVVSPTAEQIAAAVGAAAAPAVAVAVGVRVAVVRRSAQRLRR